MMTLNLLRRAKSITLTAAYGSVIVRSLDSEKWRWMSVTALLRRETLKRRRKRGIRREAWRINSWQDRQKRSNGMHKQQESQRALSFLSGLRLKRHMQRRTPAALLQKSKAYWKTRRRVLQPQNGHSCPLSSTAQQRYKGYLKRNANKQCDNWRQRSRPRKKASGNGL